MTPSSKLITKPHQTFAVFDDTMFAETVADMVQKIETFAASANEKWMEELTSYTGQVNALGQKTQLMEDAILATMKRLWSEEKIKPEITSQWEGNFWNWAKFVCQRGVEVPSDVTLQNRIAVYDFYFTFQNLEGGFCLSPTLEYEIEIVDAEENTTTEGVVLENPNLYTAAYGKLLAAKGWAIQQGGNLFDKTVAYMISPRITIREFKAQLNAEKKEVTQGINALLKETPTIPTTPPEVTPDEQLPSVSTEGYDQIEMGYGHSEGEAIFDAPVEGPLDMTPLEQPEEQGVHINGGVLYYQENGVTVPAFIPVTSQDEGGEHPLVPVGQNYILGRFGIHDDNLEVSPEQQVDAPIFALVGDEVILTVNGYTFASLTPEQAVELYDAMSESIEAITEKTGSDVG